MRICQSYPPRVYLKHEPIRARRPSLVQRLRKWGWRHQAAVTAAAVCLVVTLAAVAGSVGWLLGERAARQRDAEAKVVEALEEAAPGLRRGNPFDPALLAAVQRAEAQRDTGVVGAKLRGRVEQLLRDHDMLKQLEAARLQGAAGSKETGFDYAGADQLYADAFKAYGLDVITLNPQEAAERIRTSAIRTHLVAALANWAFVRNNLHRGAGASLSALAELADDDVWRQRLRRAGRQGDLATLEKFAEVEGVLSLPPANLVLLARFLQDARSGAAAERLLRRAQAKHPADFWINFSLAVILVGKKLPDLADAIRFEQAALALRPQSPVAHINLGTLLQRQGKHAEAEAVFRKAIALKPNLADAHSNLGVVLGAQGKLAEAEAACRKAIALKPDLAAGFRGLGNALWTQGKDAEAEAAYRKAIALKPTDAGAHTGLGNALRRQGRHVEAFKAYHRAVELQPDNAVILNNLWLAWVQEGKVAEAEAACRKAIALKPDDAEAHSTLGTALLEQGKVAEAEAAFRKAVDLKPDFVEGHGNLGTALQRQGKHVEAEAACRKAIALQPNLADAHSNLSVALSEQGRHAEAEAACRKAIALKPVLAFAHSNLGNALGKQGKHAEAEAACRKAIALKPNLADAHSTLGVALSEQGKVGEAEAACRKAIALKPGFANAHNSLGVALLKQGKLAEAEAAGRKAIALKPDDAEAHSNLGCALLKQGKVAEAEAAFRKAIALQPGFANAHNNLGAALGEQGKHAEAEAACRKAIALKPGFANAHKSLSDALWNQGKLAEAEAACRKAIAIKPDDANAHSNLGVALREQGKLAEAEAACRKAIALQPDNVILHQNLRDVLQRQGRFADALSVLQRLHEIGSGKPGWPYPSAKWVRDARRFVELDARLPQFLSGEAQTNGAGEAIALAKLCEIKRLYAAAVRFYAAAFGAQPTLASDLGASHRYNAACAAALAGCGEGKDGPALGAMQRLHWRRQALTWLSADLRGWQQLLAREPVKARPVAVKQMQHWLADTDFNGVRGAEALERLPAEERAAWARLWADVAALLARTKDATSRDREKPDKR
jgi:tetratricopeptide (TPR) repeat protein